MARLVAWTLNFRTKSVFFFNAFLRRYARQNTGHLFMNRNTIEITPNPEHLCSDRNESSIVDSNHQLSQSRINDLIGSNDVPSDEETSELLDQIFAAQMDVDRLGEEIKKTVTILGELIKRRDDQQRLLTSLKPTVSAIRRFPYEVLAHIFAHCHESRPGRGIVSLYPLPSNYHPLRFGHVSSYWRMVSHYMPTLWRSLYVRLSPKMLKAPEGTMELMKKRLSLAHPLPLDLEIFSDSELEMTLRLPFADQIRKLTLSARLSHFKEILSCAMPLIEVLDLGVIYFVNESHDWDAPAISFKETTGLHTVILRSPDFLQNEILALPWSQLTELHLHYRHPTNDLLRLLSVATHLQKFSLRAMAGHRADIITNTVPVIHHNLRDITIVIDHHNGVTEYLPMSFLFQHLTLPSLRFATMGECGPEELASFANLQSRSKFSLEFLAFSIKSWFRTVESIEGIVNRLVIFLCGYPSLLRLCLGIDVNGDECGRFMKALKLCLSEFEEADRPFLPCVEELHLMCSPSVDGQLIVDMLKTCWRPTHRMQSVLTRLERFSVDTIDVHRGPFTRLTCVVMEQFRELEREGLVISINGNKLSSFKTPRHLQDVEYFGYDSFP